MDLGDNTKSKEAYAKIKTEVKDFVLAAMEECLNTEKWCLHLCSARLPGFIQGAAAGSFFRTEANANAVQDQPKSKGSRRRTRKESIKSPGVCLQRVIEKLIMQAMADIFSHMKIVAKLSMSDIENLAARGIEKSWLNG